MFLITTWVSHFIICLCGLSGTAGQYSDQIFDNLDTAETIFQSQSTVCTDEDNILRIQCFRELPSDVYEVMEGDDVLMKCRVAYQKGKLQWAFKGKMLGFDRDIPIHPRMRMPGISDIGDHSLFIENVTVSDSGTYECQLSPAASQPPRRRMTKLVVLSPPSIPKIFNGSILVNQSISVSIGKETVVHEIRLTCISEGGNPNPEFQWTINGNRVGRDIGFHSTSMTRVNDTSSQLSLRADQVMNNDVIGCGVSNKATINRPNLLDKILLTKIYIHKRVLSGPIRFKQTYSDTITIQDREQFRLSCLCTDPGDPPIKLMWSTNLDQYPINDNIVSNDNNRIFSESTLVLLSIDPRWHRKSIVCSGTQDGYASVKPASVTVLVKHYPRTIDISVKSTITKESIKNPNTVFCRENKNIKIECSTDSYYTEDLKMGWAVKISGTGKWEYIKTAIDSIMEVDGGLLRVLRSTLEVSPNRIHRRTLRMSLSLACFLKTPGVTFELRKEMKLESYEQSSRPDITINGEAKSAILTNGQITKILCSISHGNPRPDLTLVDEIGRPFEGRTYILSNKTFFEVTFNVKPQDHGRKLRCITSSKWTLDFVAQSSDLITLTVASPPRQLSMVTPDPGSGFQAYRDISFRCFTDSSFPQSKIEWWWFHSCKAQNRKLSSQSRLLSANVRHFCESQVMQHSVLKYDPITQSTISTANLKLLPSHDGTFIECRVLPNLKWEYFEGPLSRITQLMVQYLPMFPRSLEKVYEVEEGQNITLTINASANPPINGYTWLINKQTITRKTPIQLKVDQFSLVNAQPDMMGNYTLLLENPLGKNGFNFFLNVTFPPKLLGPSTETVILNPLKEYKHKSVIMCSAQSNPFRDRVRVQWTREIPLVMDDMDLIDILKGNGPFSVSPQIHCAKDHWLSGNVSINCISLGAIEVVSSLQVMPMDHRYIGSYKCIFSSTTKSSAALKTTNLVFPTAPVRLQNQRKSSFAAKIGGKTQLVCYFVAHPVPSVAWTRSTNVHCSDDGKKYATTVSNPQTGLVKAVLIIMDTNETDVGAYKCTANNRYGSSTHSVTLDLPRSPDPPNNVTLVNTSDSSITLGWILGFNGGWKQTIELRWKPVELGRETESGSVDLEEIANSDLQFYTINNLENDKEYEIALQCTNRYTVNPINPVQIVARTMKYELDGQFIDRISLIGDGKAHSNSILIIVLLLIIGALLILLKVGLVIYWFRKRNYKERLSLKKISNPTANRTNNVYQNSAESMELRTSSFVRSRHDSTLYNQSLSDKISQNGSDNGSKMNRYKTVSDSYPESYVSPGIDLVASAMGRNISNIDGPASNYYQAYVRVCGPPAVTQYPEPYYTDYYASGPNYHSQMPLHPQNAVSTKAVLMQHPSSLYQRRMDGSQYYPASVLSMSTASGESTRSRSPHRKLSRYSPLIGQSGAPSTVEEYLSSTNSGSRYKRSLSSETNPDYCTNLITSFRLNQKTSSRNSPQDQILTQESLNRIRINANQRKNSMDLPFTEVKDGQSLCSSPIRECMDFCHARGASPHSVTNGSPLNYVDLISHSSPSVIRINGIISENL